MSDMKKWIALMEGEWNRSYGYPKRSPGRSPLDYERADRRSFKHDELEYELRHEKKYNFAVYINDKLWKIVSDEDRARRMVGTLLKKGKDARFQMTRSPVSESHPSKDQLADRWNDLDGDHGDNPKVKPFIRKAEAAIKSGDLETAMDMIKAGEAAARSLEEDLDEGKDGVDQHPEVKKRFDAIGKTKPDSYERRRAVRAFTNKKKELRNENEEVKLDVEESMQSYGYDDMSNQETENVSYSKTKTQGDASVTISANAKSMQELHDILKLAGITLPADHPSMQEPEQEPEQEVCPQCGSADCDCEPGACDCEPHGGEDPAYTTNKQAIIDRLRDTLKAKLIR